MTENSFKILGLVPTLSLSPHELDQAYHAVLRLTHPDQFVGKTGAEKIAASMKAAAANEAYQKLKSFYSRTIACLEALQISLDENKAPSSDFLMEVMSYQEALDDDNETFFPEIENAFSDIRNRIEEVFNKKDFDKVVELLSRYKYLERLFNSVQEKSRQNKRRVA